MSKDNKEVNAFEYVLMFFVVGGIAFLVLGFPVMVHFEFLKPRPSNYNWVPVIFTMMWISVLVGLIADAITALIDRS